MPTRSGTSCGFAADGLTMARTKLGDEGFLELREMLDSHEREWKKDVMDAVV